MRFQFHRSRFGALLIILGLIFVFSCSKKSTGSGGSGIIFSSTPNITILGGANGSFSPRNDSVAVGTTITWTMSTSTPHTVTSNQVGLFASGTLSNGDTFTHTFNTAGDFGYRCSIHPSMTGLIRVR